MKEAVIKADGRGVSFGLDRFDVEFRPGRDPAVLRVEGANVPRWNVATHMIDPHHACAVAWHGDAELPVHWNRFIPKITRGRSLIEFVPVRRPGRNTGV
jgi:phosphopantetheinyl transferase